MDTSRSFLVKEVKRCEALLASTKNRLYAAQTALRLLDDSQMTLLTENVRLAQIAFGHAAAQAHVAPTATTVDRAYRSGLALAAAEAALEGYQNPTAPSACPYCQNGFFPIRSDQKYCSRHCQTGAKTKRQRTKLKAQIP